MHDFRNLIGNFVYSFLMLYNYDGFD